MTAYFGVEPIKQNIYPYFGKGWEKSIWCDDGWINIIAECHSELLNIDKNYKIYQIKEKFGTLRFYYEGGNEHIRTIVDYTEFISGYICEDTGSTNDVGYNNKGFIQVLHKDLARNKNDFNFVDDEELRTILKTYDQKTNAQ